MLVLRLFRVGKNNQPSYKIVVTDKRNASKAGRFVEQVGFYNPVTKEKVLNKERAKYWLSQGVQPSATVYNFFIREGVLEGKKIPSHKKSKKAPVTAPAVPAQEAAPAAETVATTAPVAEAPKAAEKVIEVSPQSSEAPKTE